MNEVLFYSLHRMINRGNTTQEIFDKINEFCANGNLTEEERDELIALFNARKEEDNGGR